MNAMINFVKWRGQMKMSTWIKKLDSNSRFIGIPGKGYPDSLYKLYVQPRHNAKWFRFEYSFDWHKGAPYHSHHNEKEILEMYQDAILGYLPDLPKHKYWDERTAIKHIFERASALANGLPAEKCNSCLRIVYQTLRECHIPFTKRKEMVCDRCYEIRTEWDKSRVAKIGEVK